MITSQIAVTLKDRLVQSHYDSHPFDNFTNDLLSELQRQSLLGPALEEYSRESALQVDVGCGTGKVFALLQRCGRGKLLGIDLSVASLAKVRNRWSDSPIVNGSNLALPLRDSATSLVISAGVIHHTPNPQAAFQECARILAPKGHFFISVYNLNHPYRWSYQKFGAVFRRLGSSPFGNLVLRYLVVPLWYVYYCYLRSLVSRGRIAQLTFSRSINLFYDRYMVPRASFHTREQLTAWGKDCGLEVMATNSRGAMIEVLFTRP